MKNTETKYYHDIGIAITFEWEVEEGETLQLKFKSIQPEEVDEKDGEWFVVKLEGENSSNIFAQGHLKFDGCMNWETDPICMCHFCGREYGKDFGEMFNKIYDKGIEIGFDKEYML